MTDRRRIAPRIGSAVAGLVGSSLAHPRAASLARVSSGPPNAPDNLEGDYARRSETLDLFDRGAIAVATRLNLAVPMSLNGPLSIDLAPGAVEIINPSTLMLCARLDQAHLPAASTPAVLAFTAGCDWTLYVHGELEFTQSKDPTAETDKGERRGLRRQRFQLRELFYRRIGVRAHEPGRPNDNGTYDALPTFKEIAAEPRA